MKATHWWQNTAVYQIYPKSFNDTHGKGTGDLKGITEKLDYLKSLGAGALWLTPVYPSPMVDNGYDISDYCGINPDFGTLADMEELIAEAKKRGMRIVMDLVYNHTSDQHPWFLESKKSRTNAKSDWYIWPDAKEDGSAPTNWRGIFGGSAWTYSEERGQYYLHTFAEAQPDLNWENPDVREALFAAANFWLAKGVGGFRIDAITYIKKPAVFAVYPDKKRLLRQLVPNNIFHGFRQIRRIFFHQPDQQHILLRRIAGKKVQQFVIFDIRKLLEQFLRPRGCNLIGIGKTDDGYRMKLQR